MLIRDLGCMEYMEAIELLEESIVEVKRTQKDLLTFCTHYPVFTVGTQGGQFAVHSVKSDRGGSITYHDQGTLMIYFTFRVDSPASFYKKVVKAFDNLFSKISPDIFYDHKRPGFYIENKKIASLGFRYKSGVSKHGVSIHVDPDLERFNQIHPCNLKGISATSLSKEGLLTDMNRIKKMITKEIYDVFEA